MMPARPAPTLPLALLLTVLLTAWWTALAWTDLAALRLPEADDMVRLAQLRDWLDGQRFSDAVQGRLGPLGGTSLPWSRLPDLVPAAIISVLTPLMGVTRAEVAAVIFWPEILLLAHLLLAGAIAGRLGGARTVLAAVALAALAHPAVALFMPGRIDHDGLLVVLVEMLVLGLVSGRLVLAGSAAAACLLIGAEAAPVVIAAMAGLAALWIDDKRPVAGFGFGLLAVTLTAFALLRPSLWPVERCDGFTPDLFAALMIAGGAWLILAGLAPRLPDQRWRIGAAVAIGALALAGGWIAAPACFAVPAGPNGVLDQGAAKLLAFLGLPLVGLMAAIGLAIRDTERRQSWALMALVMAASIAAAFVDVNAASFAAALAAPVLAHLVVRAGARGTVAQIAAWLISAGLIWQTLGVLAGGGRAAAETGCATADSLKALDRLDSGTFAAPLTLSAYILGGTQHRVIAGPYARNANGNQVTAELFTSTPEEARYQAGLWAIDYVALCPDPHGGLPVDMLKPGGLAAALLSGDGPAWLDPVSLIGSDLRVWRVRAVGGPGLRP